MNDLNRKICDFIGKEWIGQIQPKTEFALNHNIDEKTVPRVFSDKYFLKKYDNVVEELKSSY